MPGDMILKDSHDIALGLQHKIEILDDVERAFVHVDHELRDGLEVRAFKYLATLVIVTVHLSKLFQLFIPLLYSTKWSALW